MQRHRRIPSIVLALCCLVVAGCGDDGPTDPGNQPPTGTLLTAGVAVPGQSGALHSETLYRIVVPEGMAQLTITTSGGTGDADLLVSFDTPPSPTDSTFDCLSLGPDNNETCNVYNPTAGTWYIVVYGSLAYSELTITGTLSTTYSAVDLASGVGLSNRSGAEFSEILYRIAVPAGKTSLTVTTSGGTGDVDLYVRYGSPPRPSQIDCGSASETTAETCTMSSPQGGDWYIMLVGFSAYSGVTLTATYSP